MMCRWNTNPDWRAARRLTGVAPLLKEKKPMQLLRTIVRVALAASLFCTVLLLGSDAKADPSAPPTEPVLAAPGDAQPPPPALPPSTNPSDPPASTPAVRPTAPSEPGSGVAPTAPDPGTAAAPPTAAPTYTGRPPVARPPVASKVKKYATRGVFELGGGFGLAVHDSNPGEDSSTKSVYLGGEILMNIFVTKFFYLGPRISMGFNQYDTDNDDNWGISFGFAFAPGVAFPLGTKAFLFIETFGGFAYFYDNDSNMEIIRGTVGAEAGFKFLLSKSYLMVLSIRPVYYVGDIKFEGGATGDTKSFDLLIRLGFSGFM